MRFLFYVYFIVGISSFAHAQDYVPGEVIVKFRPGVQAASLLNRPAFSKSLSLKRSFGTMRIDHFAVSGRDVHAVVNELQSDPDIEYAEPNYYLRKIQTPGETGMSYSRAEAQSLVNGNASNMTGANIQTNQAWSSLHSSGTSPVVAVIDTGVDLHHPALTDALWVNLNEIANNGLDDDHNGFVDDIHGWNFSAKNNNPQDGDGHGTHVAGIIRGVTQNIFDDPIGSPRVRIMALKFLSDTGVGNTADAISAVYYAVNNGATILNNSWGGGNYSRALIEAIAYAYERRVLFVVAAGNNGANNDGAPMYPSNYGVPNVLPVAATNDWDNMASFSNYGVNTVLVAAPGVSILSTYPAGVYTYLSGTSMAAPIVSGIAALMAYERSEMSGYQIRQIIMSSVDVKNQLNGKVATSGRVNVAKAVEKAQTAALSFEQPPYSIPGDGRGPASAGGGCGTVARYYNDSNKPDSGIPQALFVFFMLPWVVTQFMKRALPRRRYERFEMHGRLQATTIGGENFDADLSTISLGGLGFSSKMDLQSGSTIVMTVSSPDGREQLQLQGHVVWINDHKYGVSFDQVSEAVQSTLRRWSAQLVKAS